MVRRKVNQADLEENEYLAWNAYVDLLAMENFENLTDVQRKVHLIFWYSSEVENGGHLQYFLNRGIEEVKPTIRALSELGMDCQRQILSDAIEFVESNPIGEINSVDDFIDEALEDNLRQFDQRFWRCVKQPHEFLETYLAENLDAFIELTMQESDKLQSDSNNTEQIYLP